MADAIDLNAKIAEQVIAAISDQIDFVHALSLATIGGLVAFVLQIALHNREADSKRINLRFPWLLLFGTVLEVGSILSSLLAKGALTSSIAPIYRVDFSKIERLTKATFTGSEQITLWTQIQYSLFFCGVFVLFLFLLSNRKLLR